MKKFIFFILLVGLVFSCKKKQTIHIIAKNVVTGKPYSGLHYTVTRVKTGLFESNYKTVAEGTLNENGEAYITKRLTKNASFDVGIQDPGNICYVNKPSFTFADGDNFEANFEFAECGYMKLSIHNVNFQNSGDYFKLYYLGRQLGGQGDNIIGAVIKEGGGAYSYEGSYFSSVPMGKRYYKWEVTRNNVTNTYYDTIYLNAGEYKTYEINY